MTRPYATFEVENPDSPAITSEHMRISDVTVVFILYPRFDRGWGLSCPHYLPFDVWHLSAVAAWRHGLYITRQHPVVAIGITRRGNLRVRVWEAAGDDAVHER